MPDPLPRPDFAPENRSSRAGKIVAISVFALLLLGGLATLLVVLNRGSSGFVPPVPGYGQEPDSGDAGGGSPQPAP